MADINQQPSLETKEFVKLFESSKDKLIPWVGNDAVGLSVIREYPENCGFYPAKTRDDKPDSVALIRIGYKPTEQTLDKVPVFVAISKASKFLIEGNFDYDYADSHSPTKESLKRSKASRQPMELQDSNRYEYHTDTKNIFDTESGKYINPAQIIDNLYEVHLKTISNIPFRAKMAIQKRGLDFADPIILYLTRVNFWLFGRQLRKPDDISVGLFKTYPHKDLVDLTTEKIKILGSDIPVTNQTARTFIIFISGLYLLNYFTNHDITGLIALFSSAQKNNLFLSVLTFLLLFFFDRVVPHIILVLINCVIRLRVKIMYWRIKIK